MTSLFIEHGYEILKKRFFLITWISLVTYIFYDSFIYYKDGRQFYYLRRILGIGLCVSRGTATVLNVCCALILLPLCKRLNHILYRILTKLWPGLFFFWLEKAKSFHMTVASTLLLFAVIHSISHFGNMWNFSRNFDETMRDANFATYKNESPFLLLMSHAGLTGVSMLFIIVIMGAMSLRVVRRRTYNVFWYTHQLHLPFILLLIIHPLSGALKAEVLDDTSQESSQQWYLRNSSTIVIPKFAAIKSKNGKTKSVGAMLLCHVFYLDNIKYSCHPSIFQTWQWMAVPLACFLLDLLWRLFSRNRAKVDILKVVHMAGRTISVTMSLPHDGFECRMGQYMLLQCAEISLLEWHPFTVVTVPTSKARHLEVWIRVRGDWTEALERQLFEKEVHRLNVLVDGPLASPMERAARSELALCVAAGVGVTPFVPILRHLLDNPRSRHPGRIHLLWIVRHERELTWLAALANQCILQLRTANRPDRLHLELYVTNTHKENQSDGVDTIVNEKGSTYILDPEKLKLLAQTDMNQPEKKVSKDDEVYNIAKEYPILGCRVRRGRPHWDRVFGYWVHLYPREHLYLYCCGPKKLVQLLRSKCSDVSKTTKTKITFIHEGFS